MSIYLQVIYYTSYIEVPVAKLGIMGSAIESVRQAITVSGLLGKTWWIVGWIQNTNYICICTLS